MKFTLIDFPDTWTNLLPITFTRPISEIRVGIDTISEKWKSYFNCKPAYITEAYLQHKYLAPVTEDQYFINSAFLPDNILFQAVISLDTDCALIYHNVVLAYRGHEWKSFDVSEYNYKEVYDHDVNSITKRWHIFQLNGAEIRKDFERITKNRQSCDLDDPHTKVYGRHNLFLEEGASIRASIINAENGPVYLGKNATINEGAIIKGPFAMGHDSAVSMGAKFRGDSTLGPFCKVGGEVSNSVFFGYSNKSHDGFVGNAVIGEWCNLGADSNCSNLKNNYKPVKVWNYAINAMEQTDLQFCGLVMADHAKCGINTMFNTATVAGVGANIFGTGFPRTLIPSFSWGGAAGFTTFRLDKMLETAALVMGRRKIELTEIDKEILEEVYQRTASERFWEID